MKFEGVYTALITPFKSSGFGIDLACLEKLMQRQVEAGITGVILAGSTGEGQTLNNEEYETLIRTGLKFKSKIQVLGACGSSSTWQTIEKYKMLADLGVDGALVSTPPYNKAPQRGLQSHFEAIADSASLPMIVYNIPGRTSVNLLPQTLQNLWKKSNILSVKESSGSLEQMQVILSQLPEGKTLLSGDDPLNIPVWSLGGSGTVSVLSNLAPKAAVQLWKFWKSGKIQEAQKLQFQIRSFTESLFCESNPIAAKFCMGEILKVDLAPRLPLVKLDESYHQRLRSELKNLQSLGWIEA